MSKVKAAIIEDEYPAARLLKGMLEEARPDWEVIVLPGTIEDSVKWFAENLHPDILFLDIQLNDGNSFFFIEQANPKSMIVFTTAYDEYAVRAFTVNSIDYLLKPIHQDRLMEAIVKFERFTGVNQKSCDMMMPDIESLFQMFIQKSEKQFRTRFLISGARRFYTIHISDIAYFYSENKITYAVTKDGKSHVIDLPLNKLEEQLDNHLFFRANRQFILTADSIKSIESYFNGKATIKLIPPFDGSIYVSREKIPVLKMWLDS